MRIIGIGYLSESSVCYIDNGKIKFAMSEERINRIKNWYGNPHISIEYLLKYFNLSISDIDIFSTHGLSLLTKDVPEKNKFKEKEKLILNSNLNINEKKYQILSLKKRFQHESYVYKQRTKKIITELKNKYKVNDIFDHHLCHAASAFYNSGWLNSYVLTIDGWGDNASSKFFYANKTKINELHRTSTIDSLGYYYGSITKYLGFVPHRHEGKVLGLAAHGNPEKNYSLMKKMIDYDLESKSFLGKVEEGIYLPSYENMNLNKFLKKQKLEDIAASCQKRLEDVVLKFIDSIDDKKYNLCLAGGIFANVRLNQKIAQHKNVSKIYIFPNMGDGGLSVGSAILSYIKRKKTRISKINNMYLGTFFSNKEIFKEIIKYKLNYIKNKNIEKIVASKLNDGKILAMFQGRMEFGPRALGNRSILARASKKNINKWLNKKLGRTEFMPFAPITLEKFASGLYKKIEKNKIPSKFMTMTYDCTKKMIKQSPAACHIDGTARPQIVDKKNNLKLYKVLNEYYKISKIPTLINTSFNMHEEPIVHSPNDAIRAFLESKIDYLYIGKYLVYSR